MGFDHGKKEKGKQWRWAVDSGIFRFDVFFRHDDPYAYLFRASVYAVRTKETEN